MGGWRWLLAAAALGVSFGVGQRATAWLSPAQGYTLLAAWGLAILYYMLALIDIHELGRGVGSLRALVRDHQQELALVLAITLLAGVARFIHLDRIPHILGGDEASMGREAVAILEGRLTNPFVTGWLSHPTLFFYLQALALRLQPDQTVGLRVVPALAGTLTVPALYLFTRELFDRRVALVAAFYLACYHYAIHFSRLGLNNILDPLLATLAFTLLLVGFRTRRVALFGAVGVLIGLSQYAYMGARLIPIVLGVYLLGRLITERRFWPTYRGHLLIMAGGFLVTAFPLLLFWLHNQERFMARVNVTGILQTGWLASEAVKLGRSPLSLLGQQFLRAALAFNHYPDTSPFYEPGVPLLGTVSGAAFAVGFLVHMGRPRKRSILLIILYWGVVIFGGMLLTGPPYAARLVLGMLPACIFMAWTLCRAADTAQVRLRIKPVWAHLVMGLVAVALGAYSLYFYFGPYTEAKIYPGLNTEVGHEMGLYLQDMGPDVRLYFFGAPRMFADFPNTRYLAPDVPGEDIIEPLSGPLPFVETDRRPVFILLPERIDELEWVRALYPMGHLREFPRHSGGLLFIAYEPDPW